MQALQQDLWLNVPCVESQELYGMIMKYSLKVLIARYSHVVVSLSRVKQLHADITSILLFAREILPYIVMDLSSFFGFCKQNVAQSIHNLCSALLLIAVALTTPLETLYKVILNKSQC